MKYYLQRGMPVKWVKAVCFHRIVSAIGKPGPGMQIELIVQVMMGCEAQVARPKFVHHPPPLGADSQDLGGQWILDTLGPWGPEEKYPGSIS